jgi:N-acyl-D-amino-acid deacylase
MHSRNLSILLFSLLLWSCSTQPTYDLVIRNGMIYDGSGANPVSGDIAINNNKIAAVGQVDGK